MSGRWCWRWGWMRLKPNWQMNNFTIGNQRLSGVAAGGCRGTADSRAPKSKVVKFGVSSWANSRLHLQNFVAYSSTVGSTLKDNINALLSTPPHPIRCKSTCARVCAPFLPGTGNVTIPPYPSPPHPIHRTRCSSAC